MFPNSSPFNSSLTKVLAECHKGTQTNISAENISTTSDPKTSENGSLTIYEFSKLVQDPQHPKDVTIIKDVFTEETHDHGSDTPGSENAKSNRYTYCREVIKPFLKDTTGCPLSDEELIRDALLSAHQDYPDYQPCFEKNDGGKTSESSLTGATKKSKSSQTDIINDNKISSSPKSCGVVENNKECKPSGNNSDKDIKSTSSEISTLEEGKKCKKCNKTKKRKNTKSDSSESIIKSNKCKDTKSDSSESVIKSNKCKDKKSYSSESVTKSNKCKDKKSNSSESVTKSNKCKDKKSDSSESVKKSKKCKDTKSNSSESVKVSKNLQSSKHSLQSNMSESNLSDDEDEYCPEKKRSPKCPKKTRRPTIEEEVFKINSKPPAGPPSACKRQEKEGLSTCKDTPSVESCEDKKTKGSTSKKKNEDENPCNHQMAKIASIQKLSSTSLGSGRPKSIADAHDETMATIKIAFEDFVGKVYQSTKEAVTLLKSESARQLSNLTSKKSESCEMKPRKVSDDHDEKTSNKFNLIRDLEEVDLRDRPSKDTNQGLSDTAQMVVSKLITTVGSTVSMISDHESSSAYDKTIAEAAAESNSTSIGNRMFTTFKSKIMSLFGENDTTVAPRTSNESAGVIINKGLNDKQIHRPK